MSDEDRFYWLENLLTTTGMDRLRGISVSVSDTQSLTLDQLLEVWRAHVHKIKADLSLPDEDRTVWGAYDLVAALAIRSMISRGIAELGAARPEGLDIALESIDAAYLEMTEIDYSRILVKLDDTGGRLADEWWWNRIPASGPIRRELEELRTSQQ